MRSDVCVSRESFVDGCLWQDTQESPAIADKPAQRESLPKLLQFDVPTTCR